MESKELDFLCEYLSLCRKYNLCITTNGWEEKLQVSELSGFELESIIELINFYEGER